MEASEVESPELEELEKFGSKIKLFLESMDIEENWLAPDKHILLALLCVFQSDDFHACVSSIGTVKHLHNLFPYWNSFIASVKEKVTNVPSFQSPVMINARKVSKTQRCEFFWRQAQDFLELYSSFLLKEDSFKETEFSETNNGNEKKDVQLQREENKEKEEEKELQIQPSYDIVQNKDETGKKEENENRNKDQNENENENKDIREESKEKENNKEKELQIQHSNPSYDYVQNKEQIQEIEENDIKIEKKEISNFNDEEENEILRRKRFREMYSDLTENDLQENIEKRKKLIEEMNRTNFQQQSLK